MSEITELHQIDLDNGQIAKPSWSLNGRFLAVPTESGSIVIFDAGTMQIIQALGPHSGAVTTLGWSREGARMIVSDGGGGVNPLPGGSEPAAQSCSTPTGQEK